MPEEAKVADAAKEPASDDAKLESEDKGELIKILRETRAEAKERRLDNQGLREALKRYEDAEATRKKADEDALKLETEKKKAEEEEKKKQELDKLGMEDRLKAMFEKQSTQFETAIARMDEQQKNLTRAAKAEALTEAIKSREWHDPELVKSVIGVENVPLKDGAPDKDAIKKLVDDLASTRPFLLKTKVDIQSFGSTNPADRFFPGPQPVTEDVEFRKKLNEMNKAGQYEQTITAAIFDAVRHPIQALARAKDYASMRGEERK